MILQILYGFSPLAKISEVYAIHSVLILTQFERDIKYFLCDNGREYDNAPFRQFCTTHDIYI